MFKKKGNKEEDSGELLESQVKIKNKKKKPDKSIKPHSPRSTAPKTILRSLFWIFVVFILLRGIGSMIRGSQTVQEINIVGDTTPTISDSIKGFATDFATEYFTWSSTGNNTRIERLSRFINGIEQDAGMKSYQITGESKVLSVELYDSKQVDDKHFEITTLVRREVTTKSMSSATDISAALESSGTDTPETVVQQKTYMIIPVTLTENGPIIQKYPRFVMEQSKGGGEAQESLNLLISDEKIIRNATELTESFIKTYFEGNVNQLKYFYTNDRSVPKEITKSDYTLDKVIQVQVYKVPEETESGYFRIDASILITNNLGELFTNQWIINVMESDGKLFVDSIGYPSKNENDVLLQQAEALISATSSPAPIIQPTN